MLPLGLLIGPPFKNDCNPTIKNQMYGNPYGSRIGFGVRILDCQSILVGCIMYVEFYVHIGASTIYLTKRVDALKCFSNDSELAKGTPHFAPCVMTQ